MAVFPSFVEDTPGGSTQSWDVYSRLLKDRIIFLQGQVEEIMANHIVAQLLLLDSQDQNPITMYINSPGGSVSAGLAIYDTMKLIKSEVHTIVVGQAASMGSFLAMSGQKGHRYMLPNSVHMVHQPSTGAQGMVSDIKIVYEESERIKNLLTSKYKEQTNMSMSTLSAIMDRDTWITAEECVKKGLCDHITGE